MKTRKGYLILRGKTYHAVWQIAGKKFMKVDKKSLFGTHGNWLWWLA